MFGYGHEMMVHGWDNAWAWGFHGLAMLVFWGLAIAAGIALIRAVRRQPEATAPQRTALEEMRVRYARGELSREQFRQLRATLSD